MKRYGYHRTSTREQHLDRGIKEITAYCEQNGLELEKIFTDQQTGKNFNRPRYQVLKEDVLRAGDELIITEVDRLGRNKQETLKELQLVLCQDLVQVKMRNFSHFNLPKAQPQYVTSRILVRIHPATCNRNGCEFVLCCKKLPDIRKSNGMLVYNRGF